MKNIILIFIFLILTILYLFINSIISDSNLLKVLSSLIFIIIGLIFYKAFNK